jgi:hypothetical protein
MTQGTNKFGNDISFYDEDIKGPMPLIDYPTDEYDNADESAAPLLVPEPTPIVDPEWSELVADTDYEINNQSHIIRKKKSHYIPSVKSSGGYYRINLNGKINYLHRILAFQYLPNPDPETFTEVDHINRDRTDNSLSNLRWATRSNNAVNRTSHKGHQYEWHDNLPDDAEPFTRYNTHDIENLFKTLSNDFFKAVIINNQIKYRKLVVCNQGKCRHIKVCDLEGNQISICLSMICEF